MNNLRFLPVSILLAAAAGTLSGQSVLHTLLGGNPDGVAATSANLNTPNAVTADSAGNVYVSLRTTHQVVRIDSAGKFWLVAGTGVAGSTGDGGPARLAQLSLPSGLAVDTAGALYIADSSGNRIRRVATNGTITTIAGSGRSGYSGDGGRAVDAILHQPSAMAFDKKGNLLFADTANQVIRMISPDGMISRFAGNGTQSLSGDGGPAASAELNLPAGLAVDSAGNVYIADTYNQQIRVVGTNGIINLFAGTGTAGLSGDGGDAKSAYLSYPTGLAVDQSGSVYVVDSVNDRIRRIDSKGVITTYAGTGIHGAGGDEGLARFANMNVLGIAIDSKNDLLIADGTNNRVRIVTAADKIIDTLAGNGLISYSPRGVALSGDKLYFSDTNAHRVRRLSLSTGQLELVAGTGSASFSGDGAVATAAALNTPRGLALDSSGNLYIADSFNHRIRKVGTDGNINTVVGNGTAASAGDSGTATAASIWEPSDVAVNSSGDIYIAERSGHRIRKVSGGVVSTIAGTGSAGPPDAETGVATQQRLSYPQGVALGPSGSILVADTNNNRVRQILTDGTIQTIAGTGTPGFGGDGGPGASAILRTPIGLLVDTAGNVYITDSDNNALRVLGTDGIISTVAGLPAGGSRIGGFNGDNSPATLSTLNRPTLMTPASGCALVLADSQNLRIRQFTPGVDYTVTSVPPGLQVTLDGQAAVTPVTVNWSLGASHRIDAPAQQDGTPGTRYLFTGSAQTVSASCGTVRQSVSLPFSTQYLLTVTADPGGAVSSTGGWQNAGSSLVLTATSNAGYNFTGWDGDCTGTGQCALTMDSPKTVTAHFAPAQ